MMPKPIPKKSETKSNKKQTKSNKSGMKKKQPETKPKQNEKKTKEKEKTYSYFREKRATEIILAGIPCVSSFYSNALQTDLYQFEDSPALTEALLQIDLKKGVIHCNY